MPEIFRRDIYGKTEKLLFEKHPFLGSIIVIWILEIPWMIYFFPGPVEADAAHQLLMALGEAGMTGHHPVFVTKLMGKCLYTGRQLFGMDSAGIFLYTCAQFGMQSMVIAYTMYVMGRMKTPILMRWGALAFYGIYPLIPMWGYTMVKDSGYYILVLLFITALMHLLYEEDKSVQWRPMLLFLAGALGVSFFRKDGCLVVVSTCIVGTVIYKRYRKLFVLGIVECLAFVFLVEGIYMRHEGIPGGAVKEALSVPMQQTARYVREHYEEITQEETETLSAVFTVDIEKLADLYDPEISDPVKDVFAINPEPDELKAYFSVWLRQMRKHPDTYVQAFLNHICGYFYPEWITSKRGEDIGVFWNAFNGEFGFRQDTGRKFLEGWARAVEKLPVVGMLYSTGIHVWIWLGSVFYLLAGKRRREILVYVPGGCVILICMLSPVNACVRYMLPVMASFPIYMAWLKRK